MDDIKKKREIVFLHNGLGNQMFQYAFAHKEQLAGHKVSCCYGLSEKRGNHNGYELNHVFKGIVANRGIIAVFILRVLCYLIYNYKMGIIKKMLNSLSWDLIRKDIDFSNSTCQNFLVVGFWQSSEYVCDRSIFIFQEEKLSEKTKAFQQSIEAGNSISLHVRRGDYLSANHKNLFGEICTIKYYEKAIQYMCAHVQEPIFYVFSDDIPWVRDNLAIHNAVYVSHNQGMDSWQDMYLISKCKHHIIANSTFSWWGAYLCANEDKIVVCPPKLTNRGDSPDLFPDEWVKIEEL